MTQQNSSLVEFVSLDELVPYVLNARTHSDEQIQEIANSIEKFGFTNPILLQGNDVVAGHGRLHAARHLYDNGKEIRLPNGEVLLHRFVPVIRCAGWTELEKRAYILADNKLALNSAWDVDMLAAELRSLKSDGVDLRMTAFSEAEFDKLFKKPSSDDDGIKIEPVFEVIVECSGEEQQKEVYDLIAEKMGGACKCRLVTL